MTSQGSASQSSSFSCLVAARLLNERKQIVIDRFAQAARRELAVARTTSHEDLIDSLPAFLANMTDLLKRGKVISSLQESTTIGKAHGTFRASQKVYSLNDVLIEYRLLNQVILSTLRENLPIETYVEDMISDCIHLGIASSSSEFMRIQKQVEEARLEELVQTRQVIQESEHRFRQIANALPQIVWTARPDGFVDWYNDWWYEYTGASRGSNWFDKPSPMHPDDVQPTWDRWKQSLQTGEPYETEYRFRRNSDGQYRWHIGRAVPVRDQSGKISKWIGSNTDIQDQKAAEKEAVTARQELHDFIMQSPSPMVILLGPEHRFALANPPYERLVGGKVAGKTVREVFSSKVARIYLPLLDGVYQTGKPYIGKELPLVVPDPTGVTTQHFIDLAYHPFRDSAGQIKGILADVHDVTEAVEARKKVEQTLADLKAERDLREKFVATLTHDLRTPLTAAKMSAQVSVRKSDDPLTVQKFSSRVVDNIDRADRMIRDLLDANRIKAGEPLPLDIEHCDLNQIAFDTLEELSTIHGNRFFLKADTKITGHWSCGGIRRILENLCNNAIKYGLTNGPVTVSLLADPSSIEIQVHNQGSPIPLEDQPRLFEAFRRTDSALAGQQKGWGLGLTLVKGIAEAHGGNVNVESFDERLGTTFSVKLPLDARKEVAR